MGLLCPQQAKRDNTINAEFPTSHHLIVTPRSHNSHDYTTVLSSILWTLLYCNHLMPLLAPPYHYLNATSYFKLAITQQQYKTYYCSVLPQIGAISLAYLPVLSTKFRTRTWHTCSIHQYQTLTPQPTTLDKNLLHPP